MTQNKDFEASLFDMRVVLSSFELGRAPSIVIQQLAPMACSRPDYGPMFPNSNIVSLNYDVPKPLARLPFLALGLVKYIYPSFINSALF